MFFIYPHPPFTSICYHSMNNVSLPTTRWPFKVILLILMGQMFSCTQRESLPQNDYIAQVQRARDQKDSLFRKTKQSPFYAKKNFKQLHYYPIDSTYALSALVIPQEKPKIIQLPTSSQVIKTYKKAYAIVFTWDGITDTLWGYIKKEVPHILFVPFKDKTNGYDTYGGGRYLELNVPKGDSIIVDFNYAFNPYCHYDTGFSCPIVPPENHLNVAICAGEKLYR
jgi:uncharacterized protein (DUF1684 family)